MLVVRPRLGPLLLGELFLAALEYLVLAELENLAVHRRAQRRPRLTAVPARGDGHHHRRDHGQSDQFQISSVPHATLAATAERIASIPAARSCWPKTADPATRIRAPASTTAGAVLVSMPPSTSISTDKPLSRIIRLI